MAHTIIGCFTQPEQLQPATDQLLAAGFSPDQIDQSPAQSDTPEQSAGADVSGLESLVTAITGDSEPTTYVPDESSAKSESQTDLRVRVTDPASAVQAENILRQAGAKTVTQTDDAA